MYAVAVGFKSLAYTNLTFLAATTAMGPTPANMSPGQDSETKMRMAAQNTGKTTSTQKLHNKNHIVTAKFRL